jgi:hypothetical protein
MVETEANFPQVKMEVFLGYTTVGIKPVFGIAPEALDAVDVVPAFWFTPLFSDDDDIAPKKWTPD